MGNGDAQDALQRERRRWFLTGGKLADGDFLWHRERIYGGLTMFFALALLIAFFLLPPFFGRLGAGAEMGGFVALFFAARFCNAAADRCRDARMVLEHKPDATEVD